MLGSMIIFFLKYLVPFFFTFWMFFFIYKIAPNRKIHSITAFKATCFTSVLWEVAKQFFGWYVYNLGKFSVVYGSLNTSVIFVLWVSYFAAILILGGEVKDYWRRKENKSPLPIVKRSRAGQTRKDPRASWTVRGERQTTV